LLGNVRLNARISELRQNSDQVLARRIDVVVERNLNSRAEWMLARKRFLNRDFTDSGIRSMWVQCQELDPEFSPARHLERHSSWCASHRERRASR